MSATFWNRRRRKKKESDIKVIKEPVTKKNKLKKSDEK